MAAHGPPTGLLAIRGGRINQWPGNETPALEPSMGRREAMRTGPSAFALTPAIAFTVAGSQGSPPPAVLPLALASPSLPLHARQPQMPASGLRKPASNGHAEERADRRRTREPSKASSECAAAHIQARECMNVSRLPAEPVEAWHGFSCQWRTAERRGRDMERIQKAERRRLRLYRPRKAPELLYVQVTHAGVNNIVYVFVEVFIAARLYSSRNAHAPARRAICRIVDIVGGMSLSVPPQKQDNERLNSIEYQ